MTLHPTAPTPRPAPTPSVRTSSMPHFRAAEPPKRSIELVRTGVGRGSAGGSADGEGLRVVTFPPAGGSATMSRDWGLPPGVRVEPCNVRRHRSLSPELGLAALAAQIADELDTGSPYVLVGHSLGGLIAHEVTLRLVATGRPLPDRLVLMGTRPPHAGTAALFASTGDLDDDGLLDRLAELGALDARLRHHPVARLMLPALRADLGVVLTYAPNYVALLADPLPVPLHVWAGADDPLAPPQLSAGWRPYAESVSLATFEADHHFPTGLGSEVGAALAALLEPEAHSLAG